MISDQEKRIALQFEKGLIKIAELAYSQTEDFRGIDYSSFARDFRQLAKENLDEREYDKFISLSSEMIKETLSHYQKRDLFPEDKSDQFYSIVESLPQPTFPIVRSELSKQLMLTAIKNEFTFFFPAYSVEDRKRKGGITFIRKILKLISFIDFDFPPRSYNIEIFIGMKEPYYPVRICDFFGGALMISKTMNSTEFIASLRSCFGYLHVLEGRISRIVEQIQKSRAAP